MNPSDLWHRKISLHGLAVEIDCAVPGLFTEADHLLSPFVVSALPDGFAANSGSIRPYEPTEVLRRVSSSARKLNMADPCIEVFQDGERYWLVDERWGIAEVNLLRGQWRSWVLPRPTLDPVRLVEATILWPLAHVLRSRGLHLLPAASLVRGGWGVLLIAPFSVEPELTRLLRAGFRIVGQRWTALREEDGRIDMLHLPGKVERGSTPRRRQINTAAAQWIDLNGEFLGSTRNHAFCDAVLIAEPGRRFLAHVDQLTAPEALEALRISWPIVDLSISRRWASLPGRLAQLSRCSRVQLSQDPADLLVMLDSLRVTTPHGAPRVTLFVRDKLAKSAPPSSASF